ncbi:MAG: metallophosphoesterase [Victivallales bacterium]|nr:metallophosphoesterase [Victivallales bacterium]
MFDSTRRDFLKGLFAGTAIAPFGGMRLFGADEANGVVPKLRFGVVSDVHIRLEDVKSTNFWTKALRWFNAQGVDAVMVAGDIADTSQPDQLKTFIAIWNDVFPKDKGADGRHVERFFIAGNHDYDGWRYGMNTEEKRKASFEKSIAKDIKTAWENYLHEEFEGIYKKVIKGYTFIGAHWTHHQKIGEYMAAHKSEIDPNLPFFYTQHPHPKDTVHGPWVWGHDDGESSKTFSEFPNAVVFSGHSHNSLTDEAAIWQGRFTSIGTSSLRYIGHRYGRANAGQPGPLDIKYPFVGSGDSHGMLVSVYEDHVRINRHSFIYDESLGDDWLLPLPLGEKRPYETIKRVQAAKQEPPSFAENAAEQIVIKENLPDKLPAHIAVTFPSAFSGGMVFDYEIKAEIGDEHNENEAIGKPIYDVQPRKWTRRMFAPKYFMPKSQRPKTVTCLFAYTEIPLGETIRFAITPLDAYGNRGKTIYSKPAKYIAPIETQPVEP